MKLSSEEFDNVYMPIETEEEGQFTFNTFAEAMKVATAQSSKHPINHLWTAQDDDNGELVVVNGNHFVNRFGYMVTKKPWCDYSNDTKSVYIVADY